MLIALVGLAICFFINALTFAAVIAALLVVRPSELAAAPRDIPARTVGAVLEHLAVGVRYVRHTPVVLLSVTVVGVVATSVLNFQVALPLIATDLLDGGPVVFGFLGAASGAGSLVSAISLAFGGRPTLARLIVGAAVTGAATIAIALSGWIIASLVFMFLIGWGLIAMAATTNTIIQTTTPDHLRGRVMSVYTTIFAGSAPLGNVATGLIAASVGIAAALILGGLIALACALAAAVWVMRRSDLSLSRTPMVR